MTSKGKWMGQSRWFGWAAVLAVALGACSGSDSVESIGKTHAALMSNSTILGFDGSFGGAAGASGDWTTSAGSIQPSDVHDEGTQSLAISGFSYAVLTSAALAPLGSVGSTLTVDVQLPLSQPNPWWYGAVQISYDIPSQNVSNQYVGQVDLTGLPLGSFQRLSFPLSAAIQSAFSTAPDLHLKVILNVPAGDGTYLVDRLDLGLPPSGTGGGLSTGGTGGTGGTATGGTSTGGSTTGGSTTGGAGGSAGSGGVGTAGSSGSGAVGGNSTRMTISLPLPHGRSLTDTAISASNSLSLDDGVRVLTSDGFGRVASVGTNTTDLGVQSETGNVYSVAAVDLRDRAHVHGFVKSEQQVTLGASVQIDTMPTGEGVDLGPIIDAGWAVDFPNQNVGDRTVPPDSALTLAPGAYGAVTVFSRSTLTLSSGIYFFESFDLEPQTVLHLENGSGPALIYVRNAFIYRGSTSEDVPTAWNVLFAALSSGGATIDAPFRGTLVVPNGPLSLPSTDVGHVGAFYGKDVTVEPYTNVTFRPFTRSDCATASDGCTPVPGCAPSDRDGDGIPDCVEAQDGNPTTDPNAFNGMRVSLFPLCHAAPSADQIDTLEKVLPCLEAAPIETKDMISGWNWPQVALTGDICDEGREFSPKWDICDGSAPQPDGLRLKWSVLYEGSVHFAEAGNHCIELTGTTDGAAASLFFADSATGITIGNQQCFDVAAGDYPVRLFYENDPPIGATFRVTVCAGSICASLDINELRLIPAGNSKIGDACSQNSDCGPLLACGSDNGGHFGKSRLANVCWLWPCAEVTSSASCAATEVCGTCSATIPCGTSADCPSGELCGTDNGRFLGSTYSNVCWDAVCQTDPLDHCGSLSAPCGTCSCIKSCPTKTCGQPSADGCGGICTGFCAERSLGCTRDSDCAGGLVCIENGGARIGLDPTANVCLPAVCQGLDPRSMPCGSISDTCGLCPQIGSACSGSGRVCGQDPVTNQDCGQCADGQQCLSDGRCAAVQPPSQKVSVPDGNGGTTELGPLPTATTTGVGALAGDLSVGSDGSALYSVPIAVPPGRHGVQPQLALQYSSTNRNGLLGVGWTLLGLSEISRCPKTAAVDGFAEPVHYDGSDDYCLDGKKLVFVGPDGAQPNGPNAEFRTEIETFTRVLSFGSQAGAPQGFTAFTKDGLILRFGETPNSQVYADVRTDAVRVWLLSSVTDRIGNIVNYQYEKIESANCSTGPCSTQEYYPITISYGGVSNATASAPPDSFVLFGYTKNRIVTSASGQTISAFDSAYTSGGATVSRTRLLTDIETRSGSQRVRHYALTYEPNGTGAAAVSPRVHTIAECAVRDTTEVCKPPTTLQYDDLPAFDSTRNLTDVPPFTSGPLGQVLPPDLIPLDANGDGLQDFATTLPTPSGGQHWVLFVNQGGGHFSVQGSNYSPTTTTSNIKLCADRTSAFDIDHDGRDELVNLCPLDAQSPGYVNLVDGRTGVGLPAGQGWKLADVDGDGLVDALACGTAGVLIERQAAPQQFAPLPDYDPTSGHDCSGLLTMNLTGRGAVDVVIRTGANEWKTLVKNAATEQIEWRTFDVSSPSGLGVATPIDVNGDGLDDLYYPDGISGRMLQFNIGGHFAPAVQVDTFQGQTEFNLGQVRDLNGDGFQDFIEPVPARLSLDNANFQQVHFGRGDRTFPGASLDLGFVALADPQILQPLPVGIDIDGDGDSDWMMLTKDGHLAYLHGNARRTGLLRTIEDGLGKILTIDYSAGGVRGNAYSVGLPQGLQASSCAWPHECTRVPHAVVSAYSVVQRASGRAQRKLRYGYFNARQGGWSRGFLGFDLVQMDELDGVDQLIQTTQNLYDVSTFDAANNLFPFVGRIKNQIVTSAPVSGSDLELPSTKIVTTQNFWSTALSDKGRPFPFLFQQTTADSSTAVATTTTETVDGFGNVRTVTTKATDSVNHTLLAQTDTTAIPELTQQRIDAWLVGLTHSRTVTDQLASKSGMRTQSRSLVFEYDDEGSLASVTREPGALGLATTLDANLYRKITLQRDPSFGNVEQIFADDGQADPQLLEQVEYDAAGRFPQRIINGELEATQVVLDPATGELLTLADPNGVVVRYAYDGFGRVRQITDPNQTTSVSYADAPDDQSGLFPLFGELRVTVASPAFGAATQDSDAFGRIVGVSKPGLLGQQVHQEFLYDSAGLLDTESRPHLAGDSSQGVVRYAYDPRLRLTQVTVPHEAAASGAVYQFQYAARTTLKNGAIAFPEVAVRAVIDPKLHTTTEFTDARGNLRRHIDAKNAIATYDYDAFNVPISMVDNTGVNTWTVVPDRWGRKRTLVDPDIGEVQYTYDFLDRIQTETDSVHGPRKFTFDLVNRLRRIDEPDGGVSEWIFAEDGPNTIGQLVRTERRPSDTATPDDTTILSYEPVQAAGLNRGALTGVSHTVNAPDVGAATFDIGLHYDTLGRLSTIDYPNAGTQHFSVDQLYDSAGNVTTVRNSSTQQIYWKLLDAHQGVSVHQEQLGSAITRTLDYFDVSGRLKSISATAGSTSLQSLAFTYDLNGNVQSRNTGASNPSSLFLYDELDRLTSEVTTGSQPTTETYGYDPIGLGNLVTKPGVGTLGYPSLGSQQPHAPTAVGANAYHYSSNGDLSSRTGPDVPGGSQTFEYTPFDLPSSITTGTGSDAFTTTFTYDAGEGRIVKSGRGETRVTIEDLYELIHKPTGETLHKYRIYGGSGGQVAQLLVNQDTGDEQLRYILDDHLGSTEVVTDANGAIKHSAVFAPFAGNDGPWSDADQTDEATREVLSGFTGHQHDPELGLINMRGRLYDPLSGHFTTPDPFVQQATSAGINRYAYVANNPLRFVDPSGFFGWDPGAFISGLFSGGGSGGGSKASQEQCIDTGNCQDAGSGGSTGTGMLTLNPIVDLTQYGIAGSGITYSGGSGGSSAPTGSAAPNPVGSNFTGPGYGPGGYGAGGLGRTAGDEVAPGELPQGRSSGSVTPFLRENSISSAPSQAPADGPATAPSHGIAGNPARTVGRIVELGIQAVKDAFKAKPGRFIRTGARLAIEDLVRAAKAGEDVMADSASIARKIAREAGGGAEPTLHTVPASYAEQGFLPHYHPKGSGAHVFFEPKGGFGVIEDLFDIFGPIEWYFFPPNLLPGHDRPIASPNN